LRVRHPFIGVIGGLTPDKLPTLRGDRPRQRAELDGFIDRVLLSYPQEPATAGENWKEISSEATQDWAKVYDTLRSLQMVQMQEAGTNKCVRPFVVKLDGSGRHAWERFTSRHANERNAPDFPPHLTGPWSKLRGYCVRLAIIVHYLRWAAGELPNDPDGKGPIGGEDVRRAALLVAYFKSHARKVYAVMDADPTLADARHVMRWLERHPNPAVFSRHDLHRALRGNTRFAEPENLEPPIKMLQELGYIRQQPVTSGRGRTPLPKFERNPSWVHTQNAQNARKEKCEGQSSSEGNTFGHFRDASSEGNASGEPYDGPGEDCHQNPSGGSNTSPKCPKEEEAGDVWTPYDDPDPMGSL
jgi:Protein of unknown function (DUF3987)